MTVFGGPRCSEERFADDDRPALMDTVVPIHKLSGDRRKAQKRLDGLASAVCSTILDD